MKGSFVGIEELQGLVPHRGRMLLLNQLVSWDTGAKTLSAEVDIRPDCLFFDADLRGVPSWAGFEFMAQGISALLGLITRERGEKSKPGVLLSVSRMDIRVPVLAAGCTVRVDVREDCGLDAVVNYDCAITAAGDASAAAAAKITVMEVADAAHFMQGT